MTKREELSQKRECVFQQLYLGEFYSAKEKSEQCELFLKDSDLLEELELKRIEIMDEAELAALKARCADIFEKTPELDEKINAVAEGWKTGRMSRVDLSIIRLALYEMLYDEEVPLKVAINEAVELAKKYGGEDSSAFVNAILGKLAKEKEDAE